MMGKTFSFTKFSFFQRGLHIHYSVLINFCLFNCTNDLILVITVVLASMWVSRGETILEIVQQYPK